MRAKTFVKSGNTIRIADKESMTPFDQLPPQTYTIKFDQRSEEFYLEVIEDFVLPEKIYGKNTNYAERILNTFEKRSGQTGVMLDGIKGAGKTLLAKQVSVLALERDIPTLVINRDWHGDEFNSFIQSITTPCVVMFDEFEKIYNWETQRKILTLFDGVFNSRKLFIVTTNNSRDVSEFMQNRPGRIYYSFQFDTLGQDFIEEYLEDRLEDKSQINSVLKYTQVFSFFNFDMLAAAVEEMNRYGETLAEVLEVLNIQPENKSSDTYKVELKVLDRIFTLDRNYHNFQPNQFEYLIWTDDDMPEILLRDSEVRYVLSGPNPPQVPDEPMTEEDEAGRLLSRAIKHSRPVPAAASSENEDSIIFKPETIKDFVQEENKFVYALTRNGQEVELHIKRNDPVANWKYNPEAF